jgi:hypothetical protein
MKPFKIKAVTVRSQSSAYISLGTRKEAQIMTNSDQNNTPENHNATLEPQKITPKVQLTLIGLTPWVIEVNPLEPWDFEPFYES